MELARFARLGFREFVYPSRCLACNGRCDRTGSILICETCLSKLTAPNAHRCQRCCSEIGRFANTTQGCVNCARDRYGFRVIASLSNYQSAMRDAILRAKFQRELALLSGLSRLLLQSVKLLEVVDQIDQIVPIPHHWSDRIQDPYQPADIVATVLSRGLRRPLRKSALAKVRKTPKQFLLNGTQRRNNLRAAFKARSTREFEGQTVLLVDDVLTTGTTCYRATKELKKAGAAEVLVAVLARGTLQTN